MKTYRLTDKVNKFNEYTIVDIVCAAYFECIGCPLDSGDDPCTPKKEAIPLLLEKGFIEEVKE